MRTTALVVTVAIFTLTACATDDVPNESSTTAEHHHGADTTGAHHHNTGDETDFIAVLRRSVQHEYVPLATPEEAVEHAAVALSGTVTGVTAGVLKGDLPEGAVILEVRTDETWKADEDPGPNGTYYFQFPRALNAPIDYYQRGLPIGSPIVLFGDRVPIEFSDGDPGATVYSLLAQGLVIEAEGLAVNVWDVESGGWPDFDSIDDFSRNLSES